MASAVQSMPSGTREDFSYQFLSCNWPQEFKTRRVFGRLILNEPFITYLENRATGNGDGGSIEESYSFVDESDGSDESEGDESEDGDSDCSSEDEDEDETESQYGDEKKAMEENANDQAHDKDRELWKKRSNIEKFMGGFVGEEETLPYPDEVEKVVGFCSQGGVPDSKKQVALLNDTNDGGPDLKKKPYIRPYKGPLTARQLRGELEKQVRDLAYF